MKKIYIGITLVASLLLSSCSDFLDEKSRDKLAQEDSQHVAAETILTGAYGQFGTFDYAFAYLGITEIISDNADKGSAPGDPGGDKQELDQFTFTTTTSSFFGMWNRWYKAIGKASQAIEYVEKAEMTDEVTSNRYIAEARFLRALNYFFLVRGWGEVPIQAEDPIVRKPVADVYAYIVEDLLFAEKYLPVVSKYESKDIGRATQGAAQGLLAKVYLYQKEYQKAYDYASLVVNSKEYDLLPKYIDIFKSQYHNSKESIFEFQAVAASDGPAQGVMQYTVTQGARGGSNKWGWGFNAPSENLLNAYNAENDTVRRNATIIFRNGTLWDGRQIGDTENAMYNYKAYTTNSPGADWNDKSIMYMRYSEVLLIQAEAANELGNLSDVYTPLNKVRNRVKLSDITDTEKTVLRNKIYNERRLELAMEHDRWFDLIRTGRAGEVMRALDKPFVDGKNELFPIPNKQIAQTPQIGQNPGW